MHNLSLSKTVPSEEVQNRVKQLITEKGTSDAAKELGISRESISRVAAGLPVRGATLFVVKQKLGIE